MRGKVTGTMAEEQRARGTCNKNRGIGVDNKGKGARATTQEYGKRARSLG